ncbi:arginine decarboxylase [Fulvivirgaceae bacterium BMA12]|uniref:Arginine decarboxylase n=1 Tax=Agaribacillus aureus TaxID=3051825 RepID=A0ABT8L9L3_9BACT|nr:arginine decarboxylase [Fulvivirgaceae bacterium BMA12]
MKSYKDLIEQTFDFPTGEFKVKKNQLFFHDVAMFDIIEKYGTPLKFTYLPKISENIQRAKKLFESAMKKYKYNGKYIFSYCTKSSHFSFVLKEALKNDIHIETSSAFDIPIIQKLQQSGHVKKSTYLICNGFKKPKYVENIIDLLNDNFKNCIPVLDNMKELSSYNEKVNKPFQLGLRLASDEEPNFEFYTSRLGIRYNDVIDFYKNNIAPNPKAKLKLLHYFISTGIKDTAYYWSELSRFVHKYCELKKICPELDTIDIGGGFPIKLSLQFEFDFEYMVNQIVENIKWICDKNHVPVPDILTEFGSYTVGESGGLLYSVLDQKLQNEKELWYMIDGSFITHLPDSWGLNQKYILLPINKWRETYHKVNIGGLTCDSMDYYNSEAHSSEVFLPKITNGEPLYIGFFHTGAYQEALGGYGGIQHCLIPSPKHVIINKNNKGEITSRLFSKEQGHEVMLDILGY